MSFDDHPTSSAMAWAAGIIVALLLFTGLIVGGWQAGWWFADQNVKHEGKIVNGQTHVIQNGIGYQTAKIDDMNRQIGNVLDTTITMLNASGAERDALHAQRLGFARLACADASQINTIPHDQVGWVKTNCQAGTVNPVSPLEK